MSKLFIFILISAFAFDANTEIFIITNSGTTFSPATLAINAGDTVVWDISNSHNTVEVSQSTYNANGNASNGGFSLPFGGGQHVFDTPGTYYYVCTPHASLGMKGTIQVAAVTGGSVDVSTAYPVVAYRSDALIISRLPLSDGSLGTLTVYSVAGTRVAGGQLAVSHGGARMSVPGLHSGIYLVKLKSGKYSYVQKLIVR